ncbi:MAG: hypothetical protein EA001_12575 [Oscillatoriales cyanobacterium]|nr:MAG: hypothetical protein EA001_12575 [Oscillatoriales cyanobacterium]
MLPWLSLRQFWFAFVGYLLFSTILFMGSSFTMLAWIVYLFLLLPVYGGLLIVLLTLTHRYRGWRLRVRSPLAIITGMTQILAIITSPGNCYGFKQGNQCYSLAQVWWGNVGEISFQNQPPHWTAIEQAFYPLLAIHVAMLLLTTVTLRRSSASV